MSVRRCVHVITDGLRCIPIYVDMLFTKLELMSNPHTLPHTSSRTPHPQNSARAGTKHGRSPLIISIRVCLELATHYYLRKVLRDPCRFRREYRRYTYITPTSYLQLLDSYKGLLSRKQQDVSSAQRRYEVGLEKLLATEESVSQWIVFALSRSPIGNTSLSEKRDKSMEIHLCTTSLFTIRRYIPA